MRRQAPRWVHGDAVGGKSVVVSPSGETIALGNTLQLTAEAFDANGRGVADAVFSWESSDVAVATVGRWGSGDGGRRRSGHDYGERG